MGNTCSLSTTADGKIQLTYEDLAIIYSDGDIEIRAAKLLDLNIKLPQLSKADRAVVVDATKRHAQAITGPEVPAAAKEN